MRNALSTLRRHALLALTVAACILAAFGVSWMIEQTLLKLVPGLSPTLLLDGLTVLVCVVAGGVAGTLGFQVMRGRSALRQTRESLVEAERGHRSERDRLLGRLLEENAHLEASRRQLRQIIDLVPKMIFARDGEGRFLLANRAMADLYGTTPGAMIGRTDMDFLTSTEEAAAFHRDDQEVLRTGQRRIIPEERLTDAEGGLHYLKAIKIPFTTADHGVQAVLGVASDITELRQAQLRAHRAASHLEMAVCSAGLGTWDCDIRAQTIEFGSQWGERLGYAEGELDGPQPLGRIIHPSDVSRIHRAATRSVTDSRADFEIEHRMLAANGAWRWILTRGRVVEWDVDGLPLRSMGVSIDITARRHNEIANQRLATAVEQAAEGICITDIHGKIEYVNPAFSRITGFSAAEVIGANPRILKSGLHDKAFYQDLWKTVLSGRTWSGRIRNRRKDGSISTEETTISPIHDAEGRIVNLVAVKHDVNEQSTLEAQLQQAQKMEAVGQLAGGVAHDFNNMLQAIRGYAQLGQARLDRSLPLGEEFAHIVKAADRAAGLTRQLLSFSHRQPYQPCRVELDMLVKEHMKMLGRLLGEHIALDLRVADEIPPLLADPGQVEQILMNLCVNARGAMPDGGRILIEVATREANAAFLAQQPWARPGRYAVLSVVDSGCGMEPEIAARIFEPFFTTKSTTHGTGLGLSIVYGIARQHEGMVTVESEPGIGSCFRIFLPIVEPAGKDGEPGAATESEAPGGTETILLVEDEEMVRQLAARILSGAGYRVAEACDGMEALEQCGRGGKIDLVLSDVIMPRMNGRELRQRLHAVNPTLPILFITGYSDNLLENLGPEDVPLALVHKPFRVETLLRHVRRALDRMPLAAEDTMEDAPAAEGAA